MCAQTATGDTLWTLLEERGAFIPNNLKKILEVTKYDNLDALSKFTIPDDVDKIVTFMRNTLHEIIPDDERQLYYDIFKFKPDKFEIVPGNTIALKSLIRLSKYVVNECNNNVQKEGSFSFASTSNTGSNIAKESKKTAASKDSEPPETPVLKLQKGLDEGVSTYIKTTFPSISNSKVVSTVACDGHGSFSAALYCPVKACNTKIKICRNDNRWNPSNFYTHIRKHFPNQEKNDKRKKTKFLNFFTRETLTDAGDKEEFPPTKRKRTPIVVSDDESQDIDDVEPEKSPRQSEDADDANEEKSTSQSEPCQNF